MFSGEGAARLANRLILSQQIGYRFIRRERADLTSGIHVMATWDIRSRKRPLELSLPSSFSLSDGTGSSIQEGNRSPVKTQV